MEAVFSIMGAIISVIDLRNMFYSLGIMMLPFTLMILFNRILLANNSSFIYEDGLVYKITHFPSEAGEKQILQEQQEALQETMQQAL